jgi:hypothetical protein
VAVATAAQWSSAPCQTVRPVRRTRARAPPQRTAAACAGMTTPACASPARSPRPAPVAVRHLRDATGDGQPQRRVGRRCTCDGVNLCVCVCVCGRVAGFFAAASPSSLAVSMHIQACHQSLEGCRHTLLWLGECGGGRGGTHNAVCGDDSPHSASTHRETAGRGCAMTELSTVGPLTCCGEGRGLSRRSGCRAGTNGSDDAPGGPYERALPSSCLGVPASSHQRSCA